MRFVFTKLFYVLLAVGFVPLSLAWGRPAWLWVAFGYDALLLVAAIVDARTSRLPAEVQLSRVFGGRFAVGAETEVRIEALNRTTRPTYIFI